MEQCGRNNASSTLSRVPGGLENFPFSRCGVKTTLRSMFLLWISPYRESLEVSSSTRSRVDEYNEIGADLDRVGIRWSTYNE